MRMILTLVLGLSATSASSAEKLAGPVYAELVRVVDGDTILVTARPWPQHAISVLVRIRGIDTAELKSRCTTQKALALEAKQALSHRLGPHGALSLRNIAGGKYFGRVVADVETSDGKDAASYMLALGLARPYGGGKRRDPCPR